MTGEPMMGWPERALVAFAGVAGLCGVGLSAAASHLPAGPTLDIAARFLLIHAAALLGVAILSSGLLARRAIARAAGATMAAGLVLFCGDLALRAFSGLAPVPMAAPTGGVLLMLGWVLVGLSALRPVFGQRP